MRQYLETAMEAARAAGKLQKEKLWSDITIEYKGEINLVTEVDNACEDLIVGIIRRNYPDHDILAEEKDYDKLNSRYKWVIDPLDGTNNYAHGFPWFGVSIALEVDGEIRVGVIYHPMMDELFTAVKGEGAYLNGKRQQVSKRGPLKMCLLATGFPYDIGTDPENNFENFVNMHLQARGIRRAGAAALDLAYVAAGRLDGYWEAKLKPWDVAAGSLLVQEAGGKVTSYQGEAYSIYNHRIVASNSGIHDDILAVLQRKRH